MKKWPPRLLAGRPWAWRSPGAGGCLVSEAARVRGGRRAWRLPCARVAACNKPGARVVDSPSKINSCRFSNYYYIKYIDWWFFTMWKLSIKINSCFSKFLFLYYNSVLLQPHDTIFILTIKLKMFIDRIYYYTTVTCVYIYFIKIDNEI